MYSDLFAKKGLSIERLHALCLLRDHGSLIKAASGDPVRQSQLSKYLAQLASFFQVQLVEKSGKILKLTPAGDELADLAEKYFLELAGFRDKTQNRPKMVAIGAEPNLLTSLIAPQVGRLARSNKGLRFELKSGSAADIVEQLQEETLSLGVFSQVPIPRTLGSVSLLDQKYGAIIPDRLVSRGGILSWKKALTELPHALNGADKRLAGCLKYLSAVLKFDFVPDLLCSSQEECIAAIKSGYYASILPLSVLPYLEETETQIVESPDLESLGGRVIVAWSKRHAEISPYIAPIAILLKEFLNG